MRLLKDLFHATGRERRPRLVSVTGIGRHRQDPPGLGVPEVRRRARRDDLLARGPLPAYGEGITFWALGEMVRRRAGLAETDDERTTRARSRRPLAEFVPDEAERRWIEPALLALLGVDVRRGGPGEPLRRLADLLRAGRRAGHHGAGVRGPPVGRRRACSTSSTTWWSGRRDVPLLVVTLARPELLERRPDWGSRRREPTRACASSPSPRRPCGAARRARAGAAGARPSRRSSRAPTACPSMPSRPSACSSPTAASWPADGVYRAGRRPGDPGGPPHAARPHRGPPGRPAAGRSRACSRTPRSWARASPWPPSPRSARRGPDLAPRLRDLVRREFLRLEADPRSPERGQYAFLQALVREVAYGTLARRDRKARHLAAARYFESLGDDELAGRPGRPLPRRPRNAADEAEAAALAAQARVTLRGAARRAAALGSHAQALAYLEQALAITAEPVRKPTSARLPGSRPAPSPASTTPTRHYARCEELRRRPGDRLGARPRDHRARPQPNPQSRARTAHAPSSNRPPRNSPTWRTSRRWWRWAPSCRERSCWSRTPARRRRRRGRARAGGATRPRPGPADALVTKGSALVTCAAPAKGRPSSRPGGGSPRKPALALVSLRAAVNLSWAEQDDTRRAFDICRTALETARRLGQHRGSSSSILNSIDGAILLGDWDWALQRLRRRSPPRWPRCTWRTSRGTARSSARAAARIGRPTGTRRSSLSRHTWSRRLMSAVESSRAGSSSQPAISRAPASTGLPPSRSTRRSALEPGGEPDRQPCGIGTPTPPSRSLLGWRRAANGPSWPSRHGGTCGAGLAALAGRKEEAVAGYRDALARWRDAGVHFLQALSALTFLHLVGPDDPDAREAAAEARAIFERLRAQPFLDRLDLVTARIESAADASPGREAPGRQAAEPAAVAEIEPGSN